MVVNIAEALAVADEHEECEDLDAPVVEETEPGKPAPSYVPTRREIIDACRRIREKGFVSHEGRICRPWSEADYANRRADKTLDSEWEVPIVDRGSMVAASYGFLASD